MSHKRRFHEFAHEPLVAHFNLNIRPGFDIDGDARERDRTPDRGSESPARDLTVTARRFDMLVRSHNTAIVQHDTDLFSFGHELFHRTSTDELPALLEIDSPRETALERRNVVSGRSR